MDGKYWNPPENTYFKDLKSGMESWKNDYVKFQFRIAASRRLDAVPPLLDSTLGEISHARGKHFPFSACIVSLAKSYFYSLFYFISDIAYSLLASIRYLSPIPIILYIIYILVISPFILFCLSPSLSLSFSLSVTPVIKWHILISPFRSPYLFLYYVSSSLSLSLFLFHYMSLSRSLSLFSPPGFPSSSSLSKYLVK